MARQTLVNIFAMPELFEAILGLLPIHDLLTSQRVSHHWRNVINDFLILQRKLFFQPAPERTSQQPQLNPLLEDLFPTFLKNRVPAEYADVYEIKDAPWFEGHYSSAPKIHEQNWFCVMENSRRAAILRPEASWRRMFPIQPPARIAEIDLGSLCCTNNIHHSVGELPSGDQQDGARMGLIFDMVVSGLDTNANSSFRIQWHMFKTSAKEQESLKNEHSIRIKRDFWYCSDSGDPMATGLRLVENADKLVTWTMKPQRY
jgi:hypothetical protein